MDNIKKSFAKNGTNNGYIVETLSGKRVTIIPSNTAMETLEKGKYIVDDELVKLLDDVIDEK